MPLNCKLKSGDSVSVELPEPDDRYVFGEMRDVYMKCKLTEQEKIEYGHIENLLKFIFARCGEIYGNEGHVMTNSRFGDIFDIVYEDASEEALSRYDYLIDASFGGAFAKAYSDKFRILSSSDFDLLQIKINDIARKILPAYADTLHWLLSVGNSGERYISVFNNEGNERSSAFGDVIDHRADKTASLAFTCPASPKIKFASSERVALSRISEGNYKLSLPGTEFAVIEY